MSSRCRPMRGSSWSAWRSRTWTRSTASPRPSPSGRRTPRAIRARRSRPRRSSTTSSACSSRASDRRTARTAARGSRGTRSIRSPHELLSNRKGRAGTRCFRSHGERVRHAGPARPPVRSAEEGLQPPVPERATFEFSTPESLLDIDFGSRCSCWSTASRIQPELHQRLVDTVEICYRESGEVIFERPPGERRLRFSEKFACKTCGMEFVEPEPALFSFNSPIGACPRCQGFGNTIDLRHGPGHPGQDAVARTRARSIPGPSRKYGSWMSSSRSSAKRQDPFRHADLRAHRSRTGLPVNGEGRSQGIRGFFDDLEDEEVQGACPRFPEPVSRIRAVPRVPRLAAAQGSALRAGRRQERSRRGRG